jgi:hypothetical protein
MKTSKLIARLLVMLGFGGVVGLASGCGAGRASKSRKTEGAPAADSVVIRDGDVPMRVMYGVPPARFDPNRPMRESAVAEKRTVTGTVTDDRGEAVAGTLVCVMPETLGRFAVSDNNGRYSIDATDGDTLRFNYLGYVEQKITVRGDTLDVRMKPETISIDIHVIGMYGVPPARFDPDRPVREAAVEDEIQ